MQIILHQTHHQLADLKSIFSDLFSEIKETCENKKETLHLYPETYLTGYPLQDLVMQQSFIQNYQNSLNELSNRVQKLKKNPMITYLIGGLHYLCDDRNWPLKIENVIYQVSPGHPITNIYSKRLLPNYDIFDEKKYFNAGSQAGILKFNDKTIGLLICEDMWFSTGHQIDPVKELQNYADQSEKLDLIVNLSASPFFKGKHDKRLARAQEISEDLGVPLAYVNRVGAEDEILFDGQSFVVFGDKILKQATRFRPETLELKLPTENLTKKEVKTDKVTNHWEDLYRPNFSNQSSLPTLPLLTEIECEEILAGLIFGLQEYMKKCGFDKISIALSGGIDSAMVLAISHLALNDASRLEAIYMPSKFSETLSRELSEEICEKLGVRLRHFPIKFLHSTVKAQFHQHLNKEVEGLTDENIQSRLRGLLIYARSNQEGSLIINTSNKSELAVGYSTLYGDSVGAISLLGDLYKSQVYQLAKYINKFVDNLIPLGLIDRAPTAELRDNQLDSESLPPYERLDPMLEGLLSGGKSTKDLLQMGFDQEEITKVSSLYTKSEYKRNQFCPIIKLQAKSFGFGDRNPITKKLTQFEKE